MVNTEKLQKVMLVLFVMLVFFIIVFFIINTFFVSPITFHVSLEDRLLNRGEIGTLNSEIRNLAFYGVRDISVESYIVMLDFDGNVVNESLGKENVAELYSVGGFTASVVSYDFETDDLEVGRYRAYSYVSYTSNYDMPFVKDWGSKDFRII